MIGGWAGAGESVVMMPYRALLMTIVTVAVALLAVGMWISAVGPLVEPGAATQAGREAATMPARSLWELFRGTALLAFVLVAFLLVVGMAASYREWMRVRTARREKKTTYVDAWKVAGERMETPGEGKEEGGRE